MPGRTRLAHVEWGMVALSAVVGFGAYVVVRAWALSFTHDESLTYTEHVNASFWSTLLSQDVDSNNHPLTTLTMKLADDVFGPSEIALRWASVAAFALYAVALVLLLRRVQRLSLRVLGLTLAVANPYVLDFFSLARGYGLALGLVTASALATIEFAVRPSAGMALAAVALAAVAALASFATVAYFAGVVLVIVLALVLPARTGEASIRIGRVAAAIVAPTLAVALLVGIPLLRLRSEGELYFGGDDGFWQDTAYSLVSSTLYDHDRKLLSVVLVVLVATTVAAGAVASAIAIRRRRLPLHVVAFLLLAVPAIVTVVQHHVLDTLLLTERTALFFVPLFSIWLALAGDAVARRPALTSAVTTIAVAIVTATCINLAIAGNVSYVLDWRYDASTEEVITELAGPRSQARAVDLGVSYLFLPTTTFYRKTRFTWLPECLDDCLAAGFDYYYVIGRDIADVRARGARVIRAYPVSGGVLARGSRG